MQLGRTNQVVMLLHGFVYNAIRFSMHRYVCVRMISNRFYLNVFHLFNYNGRQLNCFSFGVAGVASRRCVSWEITLFHIHTSLHYSDHFQCCVENMLHTLKMRGTFFNHILYKTMQHKLSLVCLPNTQVTRIL